VLKEGLKLDSMLFQLMLIGVLGIGSQWLAWRFRLPAIVIMSIAGLMAGPFLGILHPKEGFGDLFKPVISMAVAIILFEGSLNLDFREIRGLARPVFRIITLGAFLAWIFGSLAAHYVAGLSWAVAFVIGGLFIVTGPTVILPLLRQAKLKPRPAAILKWEGIVVDPFGALLAVFAFEIIKFFLLEEATIGSLLFFFIASFLAVILGWVCGRGIGWMFERGHIPEFLKSPVVFAVVIGCFTISDEIAHETGLLAVTAMGMTIANLHIASIEDMRHFKENISVLLISAIFVMLTASLSVDTLLTILDWRIILFVLLMLFVVRPLSIWLSTIGTDLSVEEKTLIGWIAPRGIVALTVSGYFSGVLQESGFEDAGMLTSLTFALVFSTVCAHGFSLGWLAKKLDLSIGHNPGVLIVGGSSFSTGLAKILKQLNIPVMIVDSSWYRLAQARREGVDSYRGEILAEQTEYHLELTPYEYMIAATPTDTYNTLVCATFIPEFGRNNTFQLSLHHTHGGELEDIGPHIGGRTLFREGVSWEELSDKVESGHVFNKTSITEQYTYDQYLQDRDESVLLLFILKSSGKVEFFTSEGKLQGEPGDTVVSLTAPSRRLEKIQEKLEGERQKKEGQINILL
jgi:NhaP-type Na+/H+ or K+/H+ antiporter